MKSTRILFILLTIITSCKTRQLVSIHQEVKQESAPVQTYRASATKYFDLIHTDLKVAFNWEKRTMDGRAVITLKPHFYDQDTLMIDAKSFLIHDLVILNGNDSIHPVYKYADDVITIKLNRKYKSDEQLKVYIKYTARPEEIETKGSAAITSDQGLYFINADGSNKYKPKMIWTQGETQAASAWFPTLDAPNQKMTQRIEMTVDSTYVTLSNGLMISSRNNYDGTRTDTWQQNLPHAPYLAMMVVGKFEIVKSDWHGKEVSYYVEPEYKNTAELIFRETPAMIAFFSKKLGVDYPWDKYAQIVVRDYVSGSMENTSATLHGDFMRMDARQTLDFNGEEYISHELFHQWFGDLVTSESWSNITLNESFASYGEYLWEEFRHGKDRADEHLEEDRQKYFSEARVHQKDLVRFYYQDREDVFDRHSYEKGACILHMLREYTGDDAFFAALKLYLESNKFSSAEVHQLRLAFEEITGQDMNWFFNQWFYAKGHPELDISYVWDAVQKKQLIRVKQQQDLSAVPLYRLPVKVDFYFQDRIKQENIIVTGADETFEFAFDSKPDFVNFDRDKCLLAVKKDNHSASEWEFIYNHSKLYIDRLEALKVLGDNYRIPSAAWNVIKAAMDDSVMTIRNYAVVKSSAAASSADSVWLRNKLAEILRKDPVSTVRLSALSVLLKEYKDDPSAYLRSAIDDSSYLLSGTALIIYTHLHQEEGLKMARSMTTPFSEPLSETLIELFSRFGNEADADFMLKAIGRIEGFAQYDAITSYSQFLQRLKEKDKIMEGIGYIYKVAAEDHIWYNRMAAVQNLLEMKAVMKEYPEVVSKIESYKELLKAGEKDVRILQMLN